MLQRPDRRHGKRGCPCLPWPTRVVVSAAAGLGCLVAAGTAVAAEAAAVPVLTRQFPVAQVFTFLFLMLGPFKIIGPFAGITKGLDAASTNRIALLATLFSSLALLLAAVLGERIIGSYGIPLPVLALSAGLILFLVALINVVQQFLPPTAHGADPAGPGATPALQLALAPLAFPTIVTPYGVATVVVFLALSPDLQTRMTIGAVVVLIMLLNLIVMVMTRYMLRLLGLVLPILGAVLGVVQVALGLQIVHNSLKAMGMF
jgi:multiple antibiotic resistance protein